MCASGYSLLERSIRQDTVSSFEYHHSEAIFALCEKQCFLEICLPMDFGAFVRPALNNFRIVSLCSNSVIFNIRN